VGAYQGLESGGEWPEVGAQRAGPKAAMAGGGAAQEQASGVGRRRGK